MLNRYFALFLAAYAAALLLTLNLDYVLWDEGSFLTTALHYDGVSSYTEDYFRPPLLPFAASLIFPLSGNYVLVGKLLVIAASIGGIIQPVVGEIFIDGERITNKPIEERNAGYVFQEIALFPHLMAKENIGYGPRVKGEEAEAERRQVREMLDLLGLIDQASFFPSELSGGAKQKTAIGRALASGSKLLLLDEPMAGMNVEEKEDIARFILDIVELWHTPILLVEHDMGVVMDIADRIVVIDFGVKVAEGNPTEIQRNPKIIQVYLGTSEGDGD
jgi:ABC-type branched-subunit amino acid transport system ATPase component